MITPWNSGIYCGFKPADVIPCRCGCGRTLLPISKNEKYATLGCQQRAKKIIDARNQARWKAKRRRNAS